MRPAKKALASVVILLADIVGVQWMRTGTPTHDQEHVRWVMSESGKPKEKKKRVLTREQQAIWKRENRGSMKGKPREERKAAREKVMAQLQAMSESERAKVVKDLQSKWDALPEAEKQALKRKGKEGGRKGGGAKRKGKKAAAGAATDDDD
jgi:hypothetical protein